VDQVCCEAGGLCRKIRQTISISTLVKKVIIKFLLFNDLASYLEACDSGLILTVWLLLQGLIDKLRELEMGIKIIIECLKNYL
jgi:hypothetical protein